MSSTYKIEIDFRKTEHEVKNILEQADKLRMLTDGYTDAINDVGRKWKGEAAGLFMDKSRIIAKNLENEYQELRKIAQSLDEIAKNLYEAEMAAVEIANRRDA